MIEAFVYCWSDIKTIGYKHTIESKKKISEGRKGRKLSVAVLISKIN